jgi:hypothetical protein
LQVSSHGADCTADARSALLSLLNLQLCRSLLLQLLPQLLVLSRRHQERPVCIIICDIRAL